MIIWRNNLAVSSLSVTLLLDLNFLELAKETADINQNTFLIEIGI